MIEMLNMCISHILNEFARGNLIFKVVTNCIFFYQKQKRIKVLIN